MTKLSDNQRAALQALAQRGPCCAYDAKAQMRTLYALESKGFAAYRAGVGSIFSPQTAIVWRITDAGRKAIS